MRPLTPTLLPLPAVPVDSRPGTPSKSIGTGVLGRPGSPRASPSGIDQTSSTGASNG